MNALRARMIEDLQLHGLSTRTQALYVQAVRHLAEYYRKPPDQITEEELRQYFFVSDECQKGCPQHFANCIVWDQVFLRTHTAKALDNPGTCTFAKGKETAGGTDHQ